LAKVRRNSSIVILALTLIVGASAPSNAHFPVTLTPSNNKVANSPVLVDGTISFAVYANFSQAKENRVVRFALQENDELNLEYLILDQMPTNRLKKSQLPSVVVTSPSGKRINVEIKERTPFYEPYGKKNYFYLSRLKEKAEAGIYRVTATSKMKSAIVIAIGRTETKGEVLAIGKVRGECPKVIRNEEIISGDRARQLVGMSERAAEVCSSVNSWLLRVGERDGEPLAVTMDYRSNRVTVSVQSGIISDVTVG
jgi:hypothetical protein